MQNKPLTAILLKKLYFAIMKKILAIIYIVIGFILISFIGIKYHPEYEERFVIVKYKPSLHFVFYSPIGDSDLTLEELSPVLKKEELLYREFVKRPSGRTVDNIALVFFQIALFLIISSLLQLLFFRRKYRPKLGRVITINLIAFAVLLGMYQVFWTEDLTYLAIILIQIILNIVLIFPLLRKNR